MYQMSRPCVALETQKIESNEVDDRLGANCHLAVWRPPDQEASLNETFSGGQGVVTQHQAVNF